MEAAGSRQSRAASRYGASPSQPLFAGPVRKWKKQWATCSSSSTNTNTNKGTAKRNEAPPLLLCRWTPLSPAAAAAEPPKRRFRYTPIVPIVKKGKKSVDDEGGAGLRKQWSNDLDVIVEKLTTQDEPQEDDEDQED